MQLSVPRITDLSTESRSTLALYGADDSQNTLKAAFARNCILARRLIESGVRFVQLFNGAYAMGEGVGNWDGHRFLKKQYDIHGPVLDQPAAALLTDLKQRGLLAETLVVWCTEFGRMPTFQKGASGRDHNPHGFTAWLAGAGVKRAVFLWSNRRVRPSGRGERALDSRPACDDPLAVGARSHPTDVLSQRPRAASHRRARPRDHRDSGIRERPRCSALDFDHHFHRALLSAALLLLFNLGAASVSAGDLPWPCRNGPFQNGSATERDARGVPIEWDESSGKNIAWKVDLEGFGHSTPVIGHGRLWFTAATEDGKQQFVYAIDARTGRIVHHKLVFENAAPERLGNRVNTYASPSCVLEDDAVYVHFGTYGTARLDPQTAAIVWQRRDLHCRHYRGPGSSPIVWQESSRS